MFVRFVFEQFFRAKSAKSSTLDCRSRNCSVAILSYIYSLRRKNLILVNARFSTNSRPLVHRVDRLWFMSLILCGYIEVWITVKGLSWYFIYHTAKTLSPLFKTKELLTCLYFLISSPLNFAFLYRWWYILICSDVIFCQNNIFNYYYFVLEINNISWKIFAFPYIKEWI